MIAPRPGVGHGWSDGGGQKVRRLDVDRVDLIEGRFVGGRSGRAGEDAGVVHQDVDSATQHSGRLSGQLRRRHRGAIEIGRHEIGAAAASDDLH